MSVAVQERGLVKHNTIHPFFRLYQANVHDLPAAENFHDYCLGDRFRPSPSWTTHFTLDTLLALDYLDNMNKTHLTIKPGNILFNTTLPSHSICNPRQGPPRRDTFYLANFRTSTLQDQEQWTRGPALGQAKVYTYISLKIRYQHVPQRQQQTSYTPSTTPGSIKAKFDV